MENYQTIVLIYIVFSWLVVLHTFEEISQEIFELKIGRIKLSIKKYLWVASVITTINLGTLFLIVYGNKIGLYLGIFTSALFGILQALVHTIGYLKEGRKAINIGAGFYSSIPLAVVGAALLYSILQTL